MVFEHATYNVTEGPGVKAITITLKTLVQRDYPFAVVVSTQSGSADGGKCPLVTYRQGFFE